MSHSRKVSEIDANEITVQFSPAVTKAFGDLEEAVCGSEHFDGHILRSLQELAAGKTKTVRGILVVLPTIAVETMKHVRMTGDTQAEAAWEEIASQIVENGFSVSQGRGRRK